MRVLDWCPPSGMTRPTHPEACPCDDCWLARRRQTLAYRRSGRGWTHIQSIDPAIDAGHGRSGYKNGCRCEICKDTQAVYMRERRTFVLRRGL